MRAYVTIIGVTAVAVAVLLLSPGFATLLDGPSDSKAGTYNEQNSATTQHLTISLGETQYSGAVVADVTCRTVIVIDDNGRTTSYVPEYTDEITINAVSYPVTRIVQFDVTVSPPAGSSIPQYTLDLGADDATKMHGTFYLSYWTDPADEQNRVNMVFPTSGVSISGLTTGSMKICLYVNVGTNEAPYLNSLPLKPLDDVAFVFTTTVGAGS